MQGGQPYIGRNRTDIQYVFFDYELIWSLGCESVLNMPVRWAGERSARSTCCIAPDTTLRHICHRCSSWRRWLFLLSLCLPTTNTTLLSKMEARPA